MSFKHNLIKERFDLTISTAGSSVKGEFELDKNAKHLIGIAITSDRDDLLYYRGSQKIMLNDIEIFPEDFESRLLLCGLHVPPDQRMVTLGNLSTGNGKLDILYKDFNSALTTFSPYRVTFYAFSVVNLETPH